MRESAKILLKKLGLAAVVRVMWTKLRATFLTVIGKSIQEFQVTDKLKFNIDCSAKEAFSYFTVKDAEMIDELKSFIRYSSGKRKFLDIGALYGIFSLTFLANNQSRSAAYAIEPSPTCQHILKIHKKLNTEFDFHIFPIALGETNGQLAMHHEWNHLVTNYQDSESQTVRIEVNSIDEFVKIHDFRPDVIKIDVEGFEYKVLKGGSGYLTHSNPLIFLELHPKWITRYGNSVKDVVNLLNQYRYEFYFLDGARIGDPESLLRSDNSRIICSKSRQFEKCD